jgi:hypothetical protein
MSTTRNIIEGIKNVTSEGVTKAQVGLGSVDNTTDANKPVSTATQTALNGKAPIASPVFTGGLSVDGGVHQHQRLSIPAGTTRYLCVEINGSYGYYQINVSGYASNGSGSCLLSWMDGGHGGGTPYHQIQELAHTTQGNPVLGTLIKTAFGSAISIQNTGPYTLSLHVATVGYNTSHVGATVTLETTAPTGIAIYPTFASNVIINDGNLLVGGAVDNGTDRLQVNGSISASNATIYPYGGNTVGTRVFGAAYFFTGLSEPQYIHIKLPARYSDNSGERMFHLHITGYNYVSGKAIDVIAVGDINNNGINHSSVTNIAGSGEPTMYYSTSQEVVVIRLYFANVHHTTLVVDTLTLGYGDIINGGEITIVNSSSEII